MPTKEELVPVARLRELLSYDPETGIVRWKVRASTKRMPGDEAGCAYSHHGNRYRKIGIGRLGSFETHRAAWAMTYGQWPDGEIDHINGDGLDNRLCNLRLTDRRQNRCNSKKPVTNTSGYKGVSWCKRKKRWHVAIKRNYKNYNIGYFDDVHEAGAAYQRAALRLHGEFARFN